MLLVPLVPWVPGSDVGSRGAQGAGGCPGAVLCSLCHSSTNGLSLLLLSQSQSLSSEPSALRKSKVWESSGVGMLGMLVGRVGMLCSTALAARLSC